jgi:hypothetical protein
VLFILKVEELAGTDEEILSYAQTFVADWLILSRRVELEIPWVPVFVVVIFFFLFFAPLSI